VDPTLKVKKLPVIDLGSVVATPAALRACSEKRMRELLHRHQHGDWGEEIEGDAHDLDENEAAAACGRRVFSSYAIDPTKPAQGENRIWIITEGDRSVTTLLLPDDY